ncbi:NAD+ synthase [Pantanalinema sp. GBBB05]|uniref:NAD+ synthase n=1 Tax=Pantanalinema sp. GBBB05 TaxID=2604139 RepID=UPI001DEC6068|nr:NAD+ synthase [Pantanalinema sp. GBBB05]
MKIAIAQLNPTIGDLAGNAQQILAAAQTAADQGARLLLTPELSLCGYPPRDLLMRPGFIQAMATTLAQLAQDLPSQLATLVGTVVDHPKAALEGGKPLFNSSALLLDGQVQQIFHKRLLPTYDVFDEDRYFESGQEANRLQLDGINIGVTICEDLWNDEEFWGKRSYAVNPISDLAQLGVDFTVNLSASPFTVNKQRLREAMLRHEAIRYSQPVIYANQVGSNDDLIFDGCSVTFNRQGELISRAQAFQPDLVFVEFDRTTHDLVASQPNPIAALPSHEDAEIWTALVLGVRDYARKCGFSKAVIGLSGGIDSALVAAIAAAALGRENVLGVLMPSPYSSDHSVNDALQLADNLGIQTQTLAIGELMQSYDHTLEAMFAGTEFGIAEENIQSRIRGNLLMAIANKFGYLLLSTGNKSEMAVGYCTLYGDMNGGLAVIADVPKTRVYSICHWLNAQADQPDNSTQLPPLTATEVIPSNVITKAPSAELKPGQVDQDSLPPYEVLDDILVRLIQNQQTPDQIVAAGHDPAIVNKVVRLVVRAEFKRRQAPPVLKVTDRAFGVGWRMPIAHQWLPKTSQPPVSVAVGS